MAPVATALARRGVPIRVVRTGQHPGLDLEEYGFAHSNSIDLLCSGRSDPNAHAAAVRSALSRHLRQPPPLLIIVQGDTSSAFGAAQAAFDHGVPVAHVEAGLRTHDRSAPWPEEEYRIAIDARATLLFAPTAGAAENLEDERITGAVFVTGNSGVDASQAVAARLPASPPRESPRPLLLVTCHRRENWGAPLEGIAVALRTLAAEGIDIRFVLHPNPHVAATMRSHLGRTPNLHLIDPCGHAAMLQEMRCADLILSDSGGMQEEAPALGVPLLVLRDKTERPEGIADGHAALVGTDPVRIVTEVRRLLSDPIALAAMSRTGFPYGDGRASERIAALVVEWLQRGMWSPIRSTVPPTAENW